MSKIVIEGLRFDTKKAAQHWRMSNWDGHNNIDGDLYRSSKGAWYMFVPTQWSNYEHWILTSPAEVLENYRDFFGEEAIEQIAAYVEDWE
jgi:hypothetical protein